jgi:hypothetical protein
VLKIEITALFEQDRRRVSGDAPPQILAVLPIFVLPWPSIDNAAEMGKVPPK